MDDEGESDVEGAEEEEVGEEGEGVGVSRVVFSSSTLSQNLSQNMDMKMS